MYICLCHGVTDGQVRHLEASSVAEVYRALNVRPDCGKCVRFVHRIVRGEDGASTRAGPAQPQE
jgi:bacterioferritin-associated ferredoxin